MLSGGSNPPILDHLAEKSGENIELANFLNSLGFTGKSLSTNGYYKFPNGLIIQWGKYTSTTDIQTFSFPIAFNSRCLGYATSYASMGYTAPVLTRTSFTLDKINLMSGTVEFYAIAWGY
jgi:hypothetical protein